MYVPWVIPFIESPVVIGKCPECGKDITQVAAQKWSQLTRAEWGISGLCNSCQDEVFNCQDGCCD